MKQNSKRYLILGLLLLWSFMLSAQVNFTLDAPEYVHEGDRFKISYVLNEKPEDNIKIPELLGFQILMGPSVYSSRNVSIVNGKMTSNKSYTYSYVLLAEKKGKYTIPPASVIIDGKTYETATKEIEVLEGNAKVPNQGSTTQPQEQQKSPKQATTLSKNQKDNFFVKVLLSKNNLYPNEHTVATLKLYTRYGGISNVQIDPPSFNGFLSKEVPNSGQNQFSQENINGQIYNTAVIGKYILFPQRAGKLTIDDFSISAVAQQRVSSGRSIFDDFFGGSVQQFNVSAKNPPITVNVIPLPSNKPASFTNAVGKFTISSSLSADSVSTNEAVTLKITLKGNGNLQMQKAPKIQFSPDLEVYDPKTMNNSGITVSGMNGSTTFEYLIIPRQAGTFTLPGITFSYFDPSTKSYKEIKSQDYTLKVTQGTKQIDNTEAISRYQNNQQDVSELGNDIKFIKTKIPSLRTKDSYFWNSLVFWILLVGIPFIALIYFIVLKQQKARSADVMKNKSKKANKVAIKRLKTAKKSLEQNNKEEFYAQVLEALWGFASDKLHIPKSELNKDNIHDLLVQKGVPEENIEAYIATLNECEMAQYAPISSANMRNSYQSAVDIISKLEQNI
ncbi:oxygen tolerance protein BatD [Balneicella halophila]|uniref:Oxygen tolerance protein BatD n=1 Tax=Balneicella halophila TaxID=1537566 RepID=A0A7L4URW7_BALHA|nr:BatD family protein [Balneicella halophila]PVX52500.1 oxygen tolerance protein BatD [Balneicella halophila]